MVQGPSVEAIAALSHGSPAEKVIAAKTLKTILVGHDQRKALAVRNGIVQPLADLLSSSLQPHDRANGVSLLHPSDASPDDNELRLQVAIIVGSLASGGQPFLLPLCAAGLPNILVRTLSAAAAPRLVTAVLQALKAIATFWATAEHLQIEYDLWTALFNDRSLAVFDTILRHPPDSLPAKQQLRLVADIISVLPDTASSSKALLTNCGMLDTLASLLVAHAIEHKLVWYRGGDASQLPPSPPEASLPSLLAAVATIISGSNYRAHRFILAPQVRDLFLHCGQVDSDDQRSLFGPRNGFANLLPPLHIPTYCTVSHNQNSNNFPALKTLQKGKNGAGNSNVLPPISDIDHSNAVVGWLLVLVRSARGSNRLPGLQLLALVANAIEEDPVGDSHRTEFTQKTRERQKQLAMLAVPLAVALVASADVAKPSESIDEQRDNKWVRERSCGVLALLIGSSRDLQVAAVEAGAIKHVCPILKKSFDNVQLAKPMWSARSNDTKASNSSATCQLGMRSSPPEVSHAMSCRQGALQALAALAAKEDLHRKAIIDAGVVGCFIDSLKPSASDANVNSSHMTPKEVNSIGVILAACAATQSMSRSVSVLRTSLIDGGIAQPLIRLLNHPSLEVQIAATDVCCNLLPEFSPMKEDLSEASVVKMLVAHTRSSSPALRLSSLWALKHLVYGSSNPVKISTFDELGPGWLVSIIQGEQREAVGSAAGGGVSVGLSSANAAGERVELLNPSSMDVDDETTPDETMDEDDEDGEVLYDEASSTHYQSSQLRSTLHPPVPVFNSKQYLSSIREMEQNDEYTSRRDETAIQQQALDFIRNLIGGDDCAEIADHLLNHVGSAKFYELMTTKLSSLPRSFTGGRQVNHPTELVLSALHVLVHLANASPKHRQMIIAQKPLLQAILPHFSHLDHRVRVMCVWACTSFTWVEEENDVRDNRLRVLELRAVGMEKALRGLANDANLDVRERVKTAVRAFDAV